MKPKTVLDIGYGFVLVVAFTIIVFGSAPSAWAATFASIICAVAHDRLRRTL